MRCADVTGTWAAVRSWFDERGVLVLPRLTGVGPTVRLDGDLAVESASELDFDRPATAAELALAVGRLQRVVERFGLPVVYVGQVRVGPDRDPASVTIRAVAGGIVHELTLVASWYAAEYIDIDRSISPLVVES
jgi:hypothetical protein